MRGEVHGWIHSDAKCLHCRLPLVLVKAKNQRIHNRCRPEYERERNAERDRLRKPRKEA